MICQERLVEQVGLASVISKTFNAFSAMKLFALTRKTRDEGRMCEDSQKMMSNLRLALQQLELTLASSDAATILADTSGALSAICSPSFPAVLCKAAKSLVGQWIDRWVADMDDLVQVINKWIPHGYEHVRDKILDQDSNDVLMKLISNPDYRKLGPVGLLLDSMKTSAKAINSDGAGFAFTAALMKQANTAVAGASDCVLFTYACFHLAVHIPAMQVVQDRKD